MSLIIDFSGQSYMMYQIFGEHFTNKYLGKFGIQSASINQHEIIVNCHYELDFMVKAIIVKEAKEYCLEVKYHIIQK